MSKTNKWMRKYNRYKPSIRCFHNHSNAALYRVQRWLYRHSPLRVYRTLED